MGDSLVSEFMEMTGTDRATAEMYLEMSGFDVQTAISLLFDGAGSSSGGGAAPAAAAPAAAPTPSTRPPWYSLVWPDTGPAPPQWLEQRLEFAGSDFLSGLVQPKNGPCGVLCAIQAEILVRFRNQPALLSDDGAHAFRPTDEQLCDILAAMVARCRPRDATPSVQYQLAVWAGTPGGDVAVVSAATPDALAAALRSHGAMFLAPGGLILLMYSAVLTRGVDVVRADISRDGGEPPLIYGPNRLCTSELVSLLLVGEARGNVSAYEADGSPSSYPHGDVGLLSVQENEAGVSLADALKTPRAPVWILHGGDHFTVAWERDACTDNAADPRPVFPAAAGTSTATAHNALAPAGSPALFTLWHWNGLPPGGPRLSALQVDAPFGAAAPNPPALRPTYYKPLTGEIDDVVQAHPDDKRAAPHDCTRWRFEVVLAVDDPSVQGVPRPPDMPLPPLFEQGPLPAPGAAWRCRACYSRRFETMCFGMNPAAAPAPAEDICTNCHKRRAEAGWSLWMTYDELPEKQRRQVSARHAPKVATLLQTKWPGATVRWWSRRDGASPANPSNPAPSV